MQLDEHIDRIFRFIEMCGITALLNVVFRSTMTPGRALLFTLPFAIAAILYLSLPAWRRHGDTIVRWDRDGLLGNVLAPIAGLISIGVTLKIAEAISSTISIAAK